MSTHAPALDTILIRTSKALRTKAALYRANTAAKALLPDSMYGSVVSAKIAALEYQAQMIMTAVKKLRATPIEGMNDPRADFGNYMALGCASADFFTEFANQAAIYEKETAK